MRKPDRFDVEPPMRHAFAADGVERVANAAQASIYEMYRAVHAHRALFLRGVLAAIRAADALARRAWARHRERRQARAIREALYELDDRTLHDLGFNRSEIGSVCLRNDLTRPSPFRASP